MSTAFDGIEVVRFFGGVLFATNPKPRPTLPMLRVYDIPKMAKSRRIFRY